MNLSNLRLRFVSDYGLDLITILINETISNDGKIGKTSFESETVNPPFDIRCDAFHLTKIKSHQSKGCREII